MVLPRHRTLTPALTIQCHGSSTYRCMRMCRGAKLKESMTVSESVVPGDCTCRTLSHAAAHCESACVKNTNAYTQHQQRERGFRNTATPLIVRAGRRLRSPGVHTGVRVDAYGQHLSGAYRGRAYRSTHTHATVMSQHTHAHSYTTLARFALPGRLIAG